MGSSTIEAALTTETWYEVQVLLTQDTHPEGQWVPLRGRMTLNDARYFRSNQLNPYTRSRIVVVVAGWKVVE